MHTIERTIGHVRIDVFNENVFEFCPRPWRPAWIVDCIATKVGIVKRTVGLEKGICKSKDIFHFLFNHSALYMYKSSVNDNDCDTELFRHLLVTASVRVQNETACLYIMLYNSAVAHF